MANPSYFAGSHSFVIESGGNFATVQGNQTVNYFNREPERKTALTIYDQFRQVLQGDIHRTEDFGVFECRWYMVKKTICAAEVIGLEGRVFTVISYTGPEAHEAFEEDFRKYSRTLDAGPFQVFGINTNVPTVLFYDERQPLAKFLKGLGVFGRLYLQSLKKQFDWRKNEIWLDPKKGELCKGPAGPECDTISDIQFPWENLSCSAELLQDSNCLPYLASLKARDIDRAVVGVIFLDSVVGEDVEGGKDPWLQVCQPTICSASTNATVAVSGGLWEEGSRSCLNEREVMENGAIRFTLGDKRAYLSMEIDAEEVGAWMSQALSVFHARGISLDDDLRQYELISAALKLCGHLSTSGTTRQRRREKTIYLFVHPLSPSTPTEDCATSSLHHWSFDPTGQHPLPAEICEDLGLPIELSFKFKSRYRLRWNNKVYKRMHQYQVTRGLDPKTTDFARHLGYPIYQVQSDSGRFEDVDVTATSPAHSSPAVSSSSRSGDCSLAYSQPSSQFPPLQHVVPTPFNDSLSHTSTSATAPSTAFYSHTSSAGSTYPDNLVRPGAATTASLAQSSPAISTSSVTIETLSNEASDSCEEGHLEEIAVPISQSIVHPSTTQPPTISRKANGTLPKKEPTSLLGNRRNISSKGVKNEGASGRREPPRTTQGRPAREGLKGRGTALRGNIHSRSPPKAPSTSPNLRVSPRTSGIPASRVPTKPTPSVSISPPKCPQIQPRELTRVRGSVTRDAAKPGMTSEKATPQSSRTPLSSGPTHIASSSAKLQAPRSTTITPASTRSVNPSSSAARIGRPSPPPNAGTRSGIEGNATSPATHNTTKTPSKGVQQRREPTIPTRPTARPTNNHNHERSSSSSQRVWR
ncbi:hypothetical protein V5O48_010113 [Marasmius crinis-equi]|uniref:Uncharacterized protein n=1 Tax=Marasmius crinis-equi TaxID=585013 RepID=A0ABR3F995_9AGAR